MTDTYKETKVFNFPGMVARVHFPELTEAERARRMKYVYLAAENLLKSKYKKECSK